MNLTCPCCHAKYPLESALEGEAAGELQLVLAQAGGAARPLVAYLGLFRSRSRALSFDRAARLAREVLDLGADPRALAAALAETVEAMRVKRDQGDIRPLTGHNYLKRVLESLAPALPPGGPPPSALPEAGRGDGAPRGKRRLALEVLTAWAGVDWLRGAVADGLAALVADGRKGAPGADSIEYTAGLWETLLRARGVTIEEVDAPRIQEGFKRLLTDVEGWPEARDLLTRLPRRPDRPRLAEPGRTQEQEAAGREGLEEIRKRLAVGMGIKTEENEDPEEKRRRLHDQARAAREGA